MISGGGQVGIPGQLAEAVEVGHGHGVMQPVGIEADVGHADKTAQRLVEALALDNFADRSAAVLRRGISVSSTPFHMGTRKTMWRCWPVYSCVICSSMAWLVWRRAANSGETGSRTWKSMGPCLI